MRIFSLTVVACTFFLSTVSYSSTCTLSVAPQRPAQDTPESAADFSPHKGIFGTVRLDNQEDLDGQLKLNAGFKYRLVGGKSWFFSYSAESLWDVQETSEPFRDINHNPEVFWRSRQPGENALNIRCIQMGYEHVSNGVDDTSVDADGRDNRSRSIHNLNVQTFHNIGDGTRTVLSTKLWWNFTKSDNPDIDDFYGNVDVGLAHTTSREFMVFGLLRGSHKTGKGRVKIGAAGPIRWPNWLPWLPRQPNLDWYLEYFDGYGETLLDYNQRSQALRFGFLIARP